MSARIRLPREGDFHSPAQDPRVTSRVGVLLGIAFGLCFVTGVLSHLVQQPPAWFSWPTRPANLYRLTQGIHVLSGFAAVPLLLAKLWTVYPKLFARPSARSVAHLLERLSIFVLIAAAFFELGTGLFNASQNYPWGFSFLAAHYAVAYVATGALLLHVGLKLPVVQDALGRGVDDAHATGAEARGHAGAGVLSRRGFLRTTWIAAGTAVLATAGLTIPALRKVAVLGWQTGDGPQGLVVNKTAAAAGVVEAIQRPDWRLRVIGGGRSVALSLDDLRALPQATVELPIACVEGWSQNAVWTGVRIATLLDAAGVGAPGDLRVESSQRHSRYRHSTLPVAHVRDPRTLLALRLNGQVLSPDHGYPCRIIAPSRPGVLQTKWVERLEVL